MHLFIFTRGNVRRSVEQSREPQRAVTVLAPLSLLPPSGPDSRYDEYIHTFECGTSAVSLMIRLLEYVSGWCV